MYIPTMHQMMDIDSMQLAARLGHIEKDPTHASVIRFKDSFEKQQLIYFIEHYGEIKP